MHRKKMREEQTQDGLEHEYEETKKLYYRLKLWLQEEQKLESTLRFTELRSRVRQCAEGFLEKCDLFGDGLVVSPVNIPDLWPDEGSFGDNSPSNSENIHDTKSEKTEDSSSPTDSDSGSPVSGNTTNKPTEEGKAKYQRHMSAIDRVRGAYCSFEELDRKGLLTNEDSMRVHKSVHQYLEFVLGKGGAAERKRQRGAEYMRRRKSLFGPYLDNGHAGYVLGAQVFCELIGLVISPVTVPLTLLYRAHLHAYAYMRTVLWKCAEGGLDEEPCSYTASHLSAFIVDFLQPASPFMQLVEYADVSQYGPVVALQKRVMPSVRKVLWMARIIQLAPWYYYRFYIGNGADRLPALRDACTLREGLRVAGVEMVSTKEKVDAHEKLMEAKRAGGDVDGSGNRVGSKGKGHSSMVRRDQVSYGPDGAWEALDGTCLEREEGEYLYRVCLFGEIYQGSTRIGSFHHWGGTETSGGLSNKKRGTSGRGTLESVTRRYRNRLSRKNKASNDDHNDNNDIDDEKIEDSGVVDYNPSEAKQFYGNGARCFNGRDRHAVLEFTCATTSEIVEVIEYEVCVRS